MSGAGGVMVHAVNGAVDRIVPFKAAVEEVCVAAGASIKPVISWGAAEEVVATASITWGEVEDGVPAG
jgi:hypothetical protein